jgi:orotate phosphoribosyltransferase
VESTEALRQLGATVSHAICVVDRESGGPESLREIGVQLNSLFRATDPR